MFLGDTWWVISVTCPSMICCVLMTESPISLIKVLFLVVVWFQLWVFLFVFFSFSLDTCMCAYCMTEACTLFSDWWLDHSDDRKCMHDIYVAWNIVRLFHLHLQVMNVVNTLKKDILCVWNRLDFVFLIHMNCFLSVILLKLNRNWYLLWEDVVQNWSYFCLHTCTWSYCFGNL